MTKNTRNWLLAAALIPAAAIVGGAGLLMFNATRPLPPLRPLPHPNGYDDLVKAGETANFDTADNYETNLAEVRQLVARNSEALQMARAGLEKDCAVPLQFSTNYLQDTHLPELADCKRLAQALAGEGTLAEMEKRPADAVKSYLDVIRLGTKCPRGGTMIDQLVGTAIEAIGTSHLQKFVDQLDARSCREIAAALESLDAQRQTWHDVVQQENAWSQRTFGGPTYKLSATLMSGSMKKNLQKAEQRYNKQVAATRRLLIEFAARAYELEKERRPASLNDLVPDYLKVIPQDPATGTNLVLTPR